ncbi:MAG TPA: endonuclease/exonuclease/phosphatase family protein [Dongiaceae bacterium]|nr:endonuclease/exonuclease/phosphatase family protein [Dongiaceae bacterium]
MTFNIWYGGEQVSRAQVVEAIKEAGADIVGMQEADGNERAIADALGWPYVDERRMVLSRYPIFSPQDIKTPYTLVQVQPGRVVAIANVHLPATPYGPEEVRDGKSHDEVMKLEEDTRLPAVQDAIKALPPLAANGVPVFLTGDFNSPSYLDWTEAVLKVRPEIKFALSWPASKAVADAGLRDSYREAHADPATVKGFTWTAGYPNPRIKPGETFDRIDFVWTAGPSKTLDSQVVGEKGGPDVGVGLQPWPSDHRAVVSTFDVTPLAAGPLVTTDRRVLRSGDPLLVRFNLPDDDKGMVVVVKHGAAADKTPVLSKAPGDASDRPSMKFGTRLLRPGAYDVVLVDGSGKEAARSAFWLLAQEAVPEISLKQGKLKHGTAIQAQWRNAPGLKYDWVAVYKSGESDPENYVGYVYTDATVEGSKAIDKDALGSDLDPGKYELRLMKDDCYETLAAASFEVVP